MGRGVVRKMGLESLRGGRTKHVKWLKALQVDTWISGCISACIGSLYWGILLGTPKLSFHLVLAASPELKRLATAADRSEL